MLGVRALSLTLAIGGPDAPVSDRPGIRNGVGMQHTPMASAGQLATLRVAIQSDFFVQRDLFCCHGPDADVHRRYRSYFNVGWTPLSWMEVQVGLEHAVSRNDREQPTRQDPVQVYAMGDTRWGLKLLAPWWTGIFRAGLQQELQVLAGAGQKRKGRVRYGVDLLVSALFSQSRAKLPLRVAGSLGVLIDRSHRMYDWTRFHDPVSQEVFRFGVGSHQDRLRMRMGVDAPFALGRRHRWGITPMFELQWDSSFRALASFVPKSSGAVAKGQRNAVLASAGLAIHPVPRFFIDVGYQFTLLQPDFAFGPKNAPWQASVALGGTFDLRRPRRTKPRRVAAISSPNTKGR